jgi:hypothetical protein
MRQWLGLDPLAAFALHRIEAREWHISVHLVNDVIEMHAVRESPLDVHVARCNDGTHESHQFRAAKLLAEAVGVREVVARS